MSALAERLPESPVDHDRDHVVRLHGVTWQQYEMILAVRGERSAPRIAYLAGELELMSPGRNHESVKKRIARLLETWAEESGVDLDGFGSWTVKDELVERGVEPDECYVVGVRETEVPDLAIEVVWTSGGLDKLKLYAPLGVREVWTWKGGAMTVHVLRQGAYVQAARSELLPTLDLELLRRFIGEPNQTAAVRAYRKGLRGTAG
jgi:Uma2 family endonuclease